MNKLNKAQVIMLPTDNILASNFGLSTTNVGTLLLINDNTIGKVIEGLRVELQHLYIISDDEIKEGDWYYTTLDKEILKANKDTEVIMNEANTSIKNTYKHTHFKIIATTDTSLKIEKRVGEWIGTDYSLPQLSQQFIEEYIESYNKGRVITDVLIEYEERFELEDYDDDGIHINWFDKKLHKPFKSRVKERDLYESKIKINLNNTITIKPTKDSWTKEEVIELIRKYTEDRFNGKFSLDEWSKQNI